MNVEIFGLDSMYMDDCKEMDAKIFQHDGFIDVKFPQDVEVSTDFKNYCASIYCTSKRMGMVIGFNEYFSITIN